MLRLRYPPAIPPQGCWISAVNEAYLLMSLSVSCQNSVENQKHKSTKVKAVWIFSSKGAELRRRIPGVSREPLVINYPGWANQSK